LAQAQALLDEEIIRRDSFDQFATFLSEEFPWGIWHRSE
jgi:hypothetical protein